MSGDGELSFRIPVFTPRSANAGNTSLSSLSRSSLGKRGAESAGLDTDGKPSRIPAPRSSLSMSSTTLQRRVLQLEATEREQAQKIEQQWAEIERLKSERHVLAEGESSERATGEEREKQFSTERLELSKTVTSLRTKNSSLSSSLARLEGEHADLQREHSTLALNTRNETALLSSRVAELEETNAQLKKWERRAKGLSIDLEEMKRRQDEGRTEKEDEQGEKKRDEVLRTELRRQAQHLVTLERNHAGLQTEIVQLRQQRKETEAAERASKEVERLLKDEIRVLNEQLERARRDMDSLTTSFPSATAPTEDAPTLAARLTALSALHTQATADIVRKDKDLSALHARHAEYTHNSTLALSEMTKRAQEAERELRWTKQQRDSAERREALARKEVDALRGGVGGVAEVGEAEGEGEGAVQVAGHGDTAALERLVQTYKSELESMARDTKEVEERLVQGAGLVKAEMLEQAQGRVEQLERDITSLEQTIAQLTSANTTLDGEVNDLMRRVASGEYAAGTRCIEQTDNPASRIHAVRTQQLDDLRLENEKLLDRLKEVDQTPVQPGEGDGGAGAGAEAEEGERGLVPRVSYERLKKEREELEKSHAKRLMRLKEIFGNKSKEFLEAVYSLLGWRIKFDESGVDIRLTSMYAPKGKNGLVLKFQSEAGHFGTMQMSGAMARGLEDVRTFWIQERQSVPGFLAQVTTEMFEKTTIGRAAGYVGLE